MRRIFEKSCYDIFDLRGLFQSEARAHMSKAGFEEFGCGRATPIPILVVAICLWKGVGRVLEPLGDGARQIENGPPLQRFSVRYNGLEAFE